MVSMVDCIRIDVSKHFAPQYLAQIFKRLKKSAGLSDGDIEKIKLWSSDYTKEYPIWGDNDLPDSRNGLDLDWYDDQNYSSSPHDMQNKGSVYVIERNIESHREYNKQLFNSNKI